jgi:hypothetical protein
MSFPRYDKYGESGIEWFGKIPTHWAVCRLKHQLDRNDGGVWGAIPMGRMTLSSLDQQSRPWTADGQLKTPQGGA